MQCEKQIKHLSDGYQKVENQFMWQAGGSDETNCCDNNNNKNKNNEHLEAGGVIILRKCIIFYRKGHFFMTWIIYRKELVILK